MQIEIITPERIVRELEGDEVTLPTPTGRIGIRKNHVPLITLIKAGEIVVKKESWPTEHFATGSGIAIIQDNRVEILARSAEQPEELDESVIQEAIERAREAHKHAADDIELADAAAILEANMARLKVVRRKHTRSHHQRTEETSP